MNGLFDMSVHAFRNIYKDKFVTCYETIFKNYKTVWGPISYKEILKGQNYTKCPKEIPEFVF